MQSIDNQILLYVFEFCKSWLSGKAGFVVQTSGSTGTPKTIEVSRKQMEASVKMSQKAFNWQGGEKALLSLPTQFIGGKMMLVRAMMLDWHIYLQESSANPFAHLSEPFDFLSFTPYQIQNILEKSPEKVFLLNQAKNIILGGASLSNNLENIIQNTLQSPVYHTYAMTETLSHIAIRRINGNNNSEWFEVLEGVKIRLDNRQCLCITSPSTEYKELISNDLAEIKQERYFKVLGRVDNIINSGGIKISLESIEKVAEEIWEDLKLSYRYFCAGIADEYLGQKLVLVVECKKLSDEQENKILTMLS
ncbi:MAG: AMP-binding protein, partial [Thermonemataceae bacterium]|nr:AMP-binding protein [Thermonemataceae bacterium]